MANLSDDLIAFFECEEDSNGLICSHGSAMVLDDWNNPFYQQDGKIGHGVSALTGYGHFWDQSPPDSCKFQTNYSVQAWIKRNGGTLDEGIIFYGDGDFVLYIFLDERDHKITFYTNGSAGWNELKSNITITDNDWHHIVCSHNIVSGEKIIYIDGAACGSIIASNVNLYSGWLSICGQQSSLTYPPRGIEFTEADRQCSLYEDLIAYWAKVLDSDEVSKLYNSGAGLDYQGTIYSGSGTATGPTPDPTTWSQVPTTQTYDIYMKANGSDADGVLFSFECITDSEYDSGWIWEDNYTATGLDFDTEYEFKCRCKDLSTAENTTAYSSTEAATTSAIDLENSLVSYYECEEDAGSDRVDSKGSNDLSEVGGNVTKTSGILNDGIDFTNTNYLDGGDIFNFSGDFSFNFWINSDSLSDDDPIILMGKCDNTNPWLLSEGFCLYILGEMMNGSVPSINIDGTSLSVSYFDKISTSTDYMLTFTYRASDGQTDIYINNTNKASGTTKVGGLTANDEHFCIANNPNVSYEVPFDGMMDEIGIWDRQLKEAEITALYNSGNGILYDSIPISVVLEIINSLIRIEN